MILMIITCANGQLCEPADEVRVSCFGSGQLADVAGSAVSCGLHVVSGARCNGVHLTHILLMCPATQATAWLVGLYFVAGLNWPGPAGPVWVRQFFTSGSVRGAPVQVVRYTQAVG